VSGGAESGVLAAIVGAVDANPMFAMSLGSKELFHSNMLPWFIRHHQPVAQALGLHGEVTVLREKDHTDLLIRQRECSRDRGEHDGDCGGLVDGLRGVAGERGDDIAVPGPGGG